MRADREDWLEQRRQERTRTDVPIASRLRGLAQAEVAAKRLKARPEWKWFLQVAQAMRNDAAKQLEAVQELRSQNTNFDHAELARQQASVLVWTERIRTLDEILDLPSTAAKDGESARARIDELAKNRADTEG